MAFTAPKPYNRNYPYSPTHISTVSLDRIPQAGPRTPSPTVSEYNTLHGIKGEGQGLTGKKMLLYAVGALIIGCVVLLSVFHTKIINDLKPVTDWLRENKIGPLIPILILIAMSFPPLFGHEIIEILCGVTWDLAPACAIVAAGVLAGELANYCVYRAACTARSKKMEKSSLSFALLAHVVREGGFLIVLIIRYSAMPPHFATAIFSTVGLSFVSFVAACVLSLPKAFAPVYIGWAMQPQNDTSSSSKVEKIVLIASIGITVVALMFVRRKMEAAKQDVIYSRRKARAFASVDA
ncbi:hypothetical protein C8F01DRAFT_1274161 [Mycena amicta]|nr:hypothetical protein C8F01DRAFT_1274161 [Mycena amicta]